jgi:hypothetical protein
MSTSAISDREVIYQLLSKFNLSAGDLAEVIASYLRDHPAQPNELKAWRGALKKRGTSAQIEILKSTGRLLTTQDVGQQLHLDSRTSVNNLKHKGRLLAVSFQNRRGDYFPEFQFDGAAVREWIPELLTRIPDGWSALSFLTARRPELNGGSFLAAIQKDSSKAVEVLAAADAYVS